MLLTPDGPPGAFLVRSAGPRIAERLQNPRSVTCGKVLVSLGCVAALLFAGALMQIITQCRTSSELAFDAIPAERCDRQLCLTLEGGPYGNASCVLDTTKQNASALAMFFTFSCAIAGLVFMMRLSEREPAPAAQEPAPEPPQGVPVATEAEAEAEAEAGIREP